MNRLLTYLILIIVASAAVGCGSEVSHDYNNNDQMNKIEYLKANVFEGLENLNDGFDSELIYYFSESDFQIVLDRVEKQGIGIMGIEPWLNGEFYDVMVCEDFNKISTDSKWYRKAFNEFKERGEKLDTVSIKAKYRKGKNPILVNPMKVIGNDTIWDVKQFYLKDKLILDESQLQQKHTILPLSDLGLENKKWITLYFVVVKNSKFKLVAYLKEEKN